MGPHLGDFWGWGQAIAMSDTDDNRFGTMATIGRFARRLAWASVLGFLSVGAVSASEILEKLVPEESQYLGNPNFELLVVTVLAVADDGATNGSPPRLKVSVDEALRGDRVTGEANAVWEPPVRPGNIVDPTSPTAGIKESWRTRPLAGPDVGDRLIVFAIERAPPPLLYIQAGAVYRFSSRNRETALQSMTTERASGIQLFLFVTVLALCLISLVLYVRSHAKAMVPVRRARLRSLVVVACGLAITVYGVYESGISSYSDIRIDVLVLFPALGVSLVMGVVSLLHLLLRRKTRG